jgi:protein-disulfide isomerase
MHVVRNSTSKAAVIGVIAGFVAVAACQSKGAQSDGVARAAYSSGASGTDVVAMVGDKPITEAQLDARLGARLLGLKTQEFEAAEGELRTMIVDQLTDAEAARRKISREALIKSEVDDKVAPVTDQEVQDQYAVFRSQLAGRPEAEGMRAVRQYLENRRKALRSAEFDRQLMANAKVKILLEPPRAQVSADDDPAEGPANAPVTIVEFSDYQCPHCGGVEPTLKAVRERYGDRVRLVFRDFPLSFHAQARKAAEAADCAGDQGKYWEMHDHLFANQNKLAPEDLKAAARAIGLNGATFDHCLDSGQHSGEWAKDLADGQAYGITATPSFFINGRLLTGAQPLERFVQVIDDELSRAGIAPPAPDKTASK